MSFFVYRRYGECIRDPDRSIFPDMLDELEKNLEDEEHTSVSVIHESEWGIGIQRGGYINYEHNEGNGEPRHMYGLPREKLLELMNRMASGKLAALEAEPWDSGY